MSFATGAMSSVTSSPSASSTRADGCASGNPSTAVGNSPSVACGRIGLAMPRRDARRVRSSRLDPRSHITRGRGGPRLLLESLDLLGDVLGVVPYPADERGASRPLPVQPEEVQARK